MRTLVLMALALASCGGRNAGSGGVVPPDVASAVAEDSGASADVGDPPDVAADVCLQVRACGGCVDIETDPAHCGGCDQPCPDGAACMAGACVCPDGGTICDGACRDFSADPAHCGGCTAACPDDRLCVDAECVCAPPAEACGGACVDTSTSVAHCGDCDAPCPAGGSCEGGECSCPGTLGRDCGGTCIDVDSDPAHCGDCETACLAEAACIVGACVCPGVLGAICDGACTDLADDAQRCGDCETACPDTASCVGGECVCPGSPGADCEGVCTDIGTDPVSCGACGHSCLAGACIEGTCGSFPLGAAFSLGRVRKEADRVLWSHAPKASLGGAIAWVPLSQLVPTAAVNVPVDGAPWSMDVDGGHVVWLEAGPSGTAVRRVALSGGEPTDVATDLAPLSLFADGGKLTMTTEDGRLIRTSSDGSGLVELLTGIGEARELLVVGADHYWLRVDREADAATTTLVRWKAGASSDLASVGGEPMALVMHAKGPVLAVAPSAAAWGLVGLVPTAGGDLITLTTSEALVPCQIGADGAFVVFADCRKGGVIGRVPLEAGPVVKLAGEPTKTPRGVVATPAAVFWSQVGEDAYGEVRGKAK